MDGTESAGLLSARRARRLCHTSKGPGLRYPACARLGLRPPARPEEGQCLSPAFSRHIAKSLNGLRSGEKCTLFGGKPDRPGRPGGPGMTTICGAGGAQDPQKAAAKKRQTGNTGQKDLIRQGEPSRRQKTGSKRLHVNTEGQFYTYDRDFCRPSLFLHPR